MPSNFFSEAPLIMMKFQIVFFNNYILQAFFKSRCQSFQAFSILLLSCCKGPQFRPWSMYPTLRWDTIIWRIAIRFGREYFIIFLYSRRFPYNSMFHCMAIKMGFHVICLKEKQQYLFHRTFQKVFEQVGGLQLLLLGRKDLFWSVVASWEVVMFISGLTNQEADCLHRAGVFGQLAARWNQSTSWWRVARCPESPQRGHTPGVISMFQRLTTPLGPDLAIWWEWISSSLSLSLSQRDTYLQALVYKPESSFIYLFICIFYFRKPIY